MSQRGRAWLVRCLLAWVLVAALGVPGWAVADRENPRDLERVGRSANGSGSVRQGVERSREAQERRRARRATPEARQQRRESRRAFRDQSGAEALRLARAELPELVEAPVWEPLSLDSGDRVTRFVGETGAQIQGEDGRRFGVESTLPLRSEVGDGMRAVASSNQGSSIHSPRNPAYRCIDPPAAQQHSRARGLPAPASRGL